MTIVPGATSTGQGGGVLGLGPVQNTFGDNSTADRTAAETLRNTYATNNVAWLALYNNNRSFWIRLQWTNGTIEQRRNVAGDDWEDVTNVVRGKEGAQGQFERAIHANFATNPNAAPTGGEFDYGTGILTAPTGATIDPTVPATGEDIYISTAHFDPESESGVVIPTWSVWVERSHLSTGISHVEASSDFQGTGVASDILALITGFLTPNPAGVSATQELLTITIRGTTFSIPNNFVDVTDTGLPSLTADNYRNLFGDFETPRLWIGHRQFRPRVAPLGTFNRYQNTIYEGEHPSDPSGFHNAGEFYYNTTRQAWYVAAVYFAVTVWNQRSFESLFGAFATWLSEEVSPQLALERILVHDPNRFYYFYNRTSGHVEVLDNSTYQAPVDESEHFTAEPVGAGTLAVGTISSVVAGRGLTGGGDSGSVTIDVDPSESDFPTIPLDKGGTGATTQTTALAALGGLTQVQVDARAVVRYTNTEKTKLAGIETSATADQTGQELSTALDAFIGNALWRSRLSGQFLIDAIDAAVTNTMWRTGHTALRTAQELVTLLDGHFGGTAWRTGGGGGGGTGYTDADATDAAGALLATLALFTYDSTTNSLTIAIPDDYITPAMLVADSAAEKNDMRTRIGAQGTLVEPTNDQAIDQSGNTILGWTARRVLASIDARVIGSRIVGLLAALTGSARLGVAAINGAAALAGASFAGAVVFNNTASGQTPTLDAHLANKAYVDSRISSGGTTPVTDDLYFGTSDDAIPEAAELTIMGVNGSGVIAAYPGDKHHIIARLASEPDITRVVYSDDPTQDNEIGAYTKIANTLVPSPETQPFAVWITHQALSNSADVTITVG